MDFEVFGRKNLYRLSVKLTNLNSLDGVKASKWGSLVRDSPQGAIGSNLYKPPVDKRTGDLQWRMVHGAIATNRYLVHLDPSAGDGCPFCSES